MGVLLRRIGKVRIWRHVDLMGESALQRSIISCEDERQVRTGLLTCSVGKARMPPSTVLVHPCHGVLGYMLADPKNKVEGLSLPRGGLIKDQTFVDDTALYLKGTSSNLDKAQKVLTTFSAASGAKVNWHKLAAIWASKKERTWGMDEGEAGTDEGGSDQHYRNPQATNIPKSVGSQQTRNPVGLGRIEQRERLRESRLHSNQRPLEPW
ncbi:unnamed protein product [Sphagnum jensenii]|uniref:Reverse transcriptase domain-containing protein n=1 Tax=Sphagnum jensenii TaxID=128206 RepID=A0ABP1BZM0_9BRYO